MDRSEELNERVSTWVDSAELPIQPKRIELSTFEDALGQDGWQVTITLPHPIGSTWDQEALFKTRRAISNELDRITAELDAGLPGSTLVNATTDEALDDETALEDTPPTETEEL